MHVLVIGGTGFVGAHVVRRLAEQNHRITVFHRGETQADLLASVAFIRGDRTDLTAHADVLRAAAPDLVLDGIAYTEDETRAAVDIFRDTARRLVVLSSQDVYRAYDRWRRADTGPPDAVPLDENSPLRDQLYPYRTYADGPADRLYHYDKILVERAARAAPELPATILRLPQVYGPGDRQHRLRPYLRRLLSGEDVSLEAGQAAWRWTRGYVENVAAAVALAVTDERAAGHVYNVGEPETLTERDWVRRIGEMVGWNGHVRHVEHDTVPDDLRYEADWRQHLLANTQRLRRDLGFVEPVPAAEALRRSIVWERRSGT